MADPENGAERRRRDNRRGNKSAIDWSTIDWSKPNQQIAFEVGLSMPSVGYHRKRIGGDALKASKRVWPDDVGKVSDSIIAERLGLTRQAVEQYRHNRGIPAPPRPPRASMGEVVAVLARRAVGESPRPSDERVLRMFLEARNLEETVSRVVRTDP